jgi:hypothetical protein
MVEKAIQTNLNPNSNISAKALTQKQLEYIIFCNIHAETLINVIFFELMNLLSVLILKG